ncbi:MAG: molecular chaperone GrpE, partial [Methanosaeta sp. ASP1-2]
MADADERSEAKPETSDANEEELLMRLSSAESLAQERLDLLMRCRAELDNVMKRSAREKEETVKYASE